jgi:hypothetical protein
MRARITSALTLPVSKLFLTVSRMEKSRSQAAL